MKNQREFATNAGSRMLKAWVSAAACMAAVAVGGVAHAADPYPSKPVTLVVPFATGGATDIVGRVLADRLSKELGQQVIVENKAGAGGITGSQYVLDKPADGYTLLLAISSKTVMTELQEKAPYDPLKDFQTVSLIAKIPTLLVVPSSLNVKTFEDFKTYLAQNGNKVSWAAPGIGTAPHMTGTVLMDAMDSEAQVVHYRGSAPIHTDLVSARIHFTTDSVIAIKPHIESGAVVPVAAVGHQRVGQFPDVPTLGELGYTAFNEVLFDGWNAIDVRQGTPEPVVTRLNEALTAALADPAVKQRIEQMGLALFEPQTPQEAQAFVDQTAAVLKPLVASFQKP